jgi:AcrR family transcriptional regulator
MPAGDRSHLRRRTRKALLEAGARLLRQGEQPTMADIAAAAQVSRATAYRYFDSADALLCEAPVDAVVPPPEDLFEQHDAASVEERVVAAERVLHEVSWRNAPQLRAMLAHTLRVSLDSDRHSDVPLRQNRRIPMIEAALTPARSRLDDATYAKLCAALALVFGTESMVVFQDVLQMNEDRARDVKDWAARALVRAALQEAGG